MSKQLLNKYQNGPVSVEIYSDGTKIREWDDEKYGKVPRLEFAESCDIKITNSCSMGCPYCHEQSEPHGRHGDLKSFMQILDISNLPAGIEFAVGGGNPLDHPDIDEFLHYCNDKGFIVNMTMNLYHLFPSNEVTSHEHLNNQTYLQYIEYALKENLIKGLGVSTTSINQFIATGVWKLSPNVVVHMIEGVCDEPTKVLERCVRYHKEQDQNFKPKILILGWKDFGRLRKSESEHKTKVAEASDLWKTNILQFIKEINSIGGVVAFDNLAVKHFDLLNRLPEAVVKTQYMGNDGKASGTFYIDLVEWKFGRQSTVPKDQRVDIEDKSMRDMFRIVREEM